MEMCQKWRLSGDLGLPSLDEEKIILEFHSKEEAIWGFENGYKSFRHVYSCARTMDPKRGLCEGDRFFGEVVGEDRRATSLSMGDGDFGTSRRRLRWVS